MSENSSEPKKFHQAHNSQAGENAWRENIDNRWNKKRSIGELARKTTQVPTYEVKTFYFIPFPMKIEEFIVKQNIFWWKTQERN